MTGKGTLTSEISHYTGDFLNSKKEGFGVIKFLKTGNMFEGVYKNG